MTDKCKGKNKTAHNAQKATLLHRELLIYPGSWQGLLHGKDAQGSNFASSLVAHAYSLDLSFIAVQRKNYWLQMEYY